MLEEELRTVVQYVDAAMVGRLGADASATVGITTMVTWLINSPLGAAGIGVMAYISRSVGAGETEKVKRFHTGNFYGCCMGSPGERNCSWSKRIHALYINVLLIF